MSLWTLLFVLSVFWIAIHTLHNLWRPSSSLLPTPSLSSRRSCRLWNAQVVIKSLHLRIHTTAWNLRHDALAGSIARRKNRHVKTALTYFYNVGCAVGVLGMIASLGILLWACGQMGFSLIERLYGLQPASGLRKRELEADKDTYTRHARFLAPIVPGVTVPLAHLPFVLVAVFIGQIIHEAGHGICAALESVPILSAGASFVVFLPSAFVALSTASLESLSPMGRLRIIAAGPFHNLVFWCLLVAVGKTNVGDALWSVVGYTDISSSGRVVIAVDKDSALNRHLLPGTLITALDDTSLGISSLSESDTWTSYLVGSKRPSGTNITGWCVDEALYRVSSQTCCTSQGNIGGPSPLSCFTSLSSPSELGCLDPVPVLTQHESGRCTSAMECAQQALCVRPHDNEHLLRMTLYHSFPPRSNQEVILWRGPRREVWDEVQVGHLMPRSDFLPLWLPLTAQTFMDYLGLATLSLYLFNLLPFPLLDGAQLLAVIRDILFPSETDTTSRWLNLLPFS